MAPGQGTGALKCRIRKGFIKARAKQTKLLHMRSGKRNQCEQGRPRKVQSHEQAEQEEWR